MSSGPRWGLPSRSHHQTGPLRSSSMNIGARLAVLANRPLDGSSARRLQITGSERRFPPRFNRESEPTGFSGQYERCPLRTHISNRLQLCSVINFRQGQLIQDLVQRNRVPVRRRQQPVATLQPPPGLEVIDPAALREQPGPPVTSARKRASAVSGPVSVTRMGKNRPCSCS